MKKISPLRSAELPVVSSESEIHTECEGDHKQEPTGYFHDRSACCPTRHTSPSKATNVNNANGKKVCQD